MASKSIILTLRRDSLVAMSYYGVLDVCLHFHSFRNVDLLHQGLYQLRARVYSDLLEDHSQLIPGTPYTAPPEKVHAGGSANSQCVAVFPYAMIPSRLHQEDFKLAILPKGSLEQRSACIQRSECPEIASSNKAGRAEHHCVVPPSIDAQMQSFHTTTFLIRYCDEEVDLNNLCQFRLELDLCQKHALATPVYLEIDLMYADPSASNGFGAANRQVISSSQKTSATNEVVNTTSVTNVESCSVAEREMFASRLRDKSSFEGFAARPTEDSGVVLSPKNFPWKPDFYSVAYQVYKIHNPCHGLHEYVPVIFDEYHFSLCSLSVHTCLMDIRPRLRPNVLPCGYQPRHRRPKPPPTMLYDRDQTEPVVQDSTTEVSVTSSRKQSPAAPPTTQTFNDFLTKGHRGVSDFSATVVRIHGFESNPGPDRSKPRSKSTGNVLDSQSNNDKPSTTCIEEEESSPLHLMPSIPPWLIRADSLYLEYLRILLESLAQSFLFFRSITCRCFTPQERGSLGPTLDLPPIDLPGGDRVLLPGAVKIPRGSLLQQQLLEHGASTENLPDASTSRLPRGHFRGSGLSFYTEADLRTVTFHLSSDIVEEELYHLTESQEAERLSCNERVVTSTPGDFLFPKALDVKAHIPLLSARLESSESHAMAAILTQDFQLIGGQILTLWQRFLNVLPVLNSEICCYLRQRYENRIADYWRESIFRETCHESEIMFPAEKCLWEVHQRIADHLRKSMHYRFLEPFPVTDICLLPASDCRPILFEQRYGSPQQWNAGTEKDKSAIASQSSLQRTKDTTHLSAKRNHVTRTPVRGIHCVVFVHGFQGNSYDMRLLRNVVSAFYPSIVLLCSSSNEDDTEGCIQAMGKRLAKEITRFLDEWSLSNSLERLSFVCHSLGGVIARAALIHLVELWPKLYTFISLSSPHLGYMYSSNRWVEAGLWVLKKWKKSISLQQLTLCDTKTMHDSFLYKLSTESKALGYFQHVCFVSSYQDQYVPFESARVEMSSRAEKDARLGRVYGEMTNNILKDIQPHRFIRFNVNFRIMEKSLDNFIGRAAHIQFLENSVLMYMLVQAYPQDRKSVV